MRCLEGYLTTCTDNEKSIPFAESGKSCCCNIRYEYVRQEGNYKSVTHNDPCGVGSCVGAGACGLSSQYCPIIRDENISSVFSRGMSVLTESTYTYSTPTGGYGPGGPIGEAWRPQFRILIGLAKFCSYHPMIAEASSPCLDCLPPNRVQLP